MLKALLLLIFFYITWATVNTALGHWAGLGREFLPVSMAAVVAVLGFHLLKLRRCRE